MIVMLIGSMRLAKTNMAQRLVLQDTWGTTYLRSVDHLRPI